MAKKPTKPSHLDLSSKVAGADAFKVCPFCGDMMDEEACEDFVASASVTPPAEEAPVDLAAALSPAPPTMEEATPRTHVLVDYHANGQYVLEPAPPAWYFDRRIVLKRRERRPTPHIGVFQEVVVQVNLEHVGEGDKGIWQYRVMA